MCVMGWAIESTRFKSPATGTWWTYGQSAHFLLHTRVDEVLVITPAELIANKVAAYFGARGSPKAFTDRRDLAVLLLRFPEPQERNRASARTP